MKRFLPRRHGTCLLIGLALTCWGLLQAQNPFQQYHDTVEHNDEPLPPDWRKPSEWVFARMKYRDVHRFDYGRDLYWTMDYPRGDRHLAQGLRRLTLVDARSVEQVVEMDGSTDVYNWPFLYGVEVGMWDPTEEQASQLRDYLLRGGFLMVDDFHGLIEWDTFEAAMNMVFPNRSIVELNPKDLIFHVFTDVNELVQIPGEQYISSGLTYEKGGTVPHYRGIVDDRGRVMVVICYNMDLGDAVEHSDNPRYPERFASLAYRVWTNYVIYNLTH
ncbi:MAG: DUF4159 domain-containing protein [Acidobacteriota bacterium]